jgi:ABC-type lipoprotein release transport system permease subunit
MNLDAVIHRLPVGWIVRFVLLRLLSRWPSILVTVLSVGLVTVIGATIPLYTASIAQVGMQQRLEQQARDTQINVHISMSASETGDVLAAWSEYDAAIRQHVDQTLGAAVPNWVSQTLTLAETTPMQAVYHGEDLPARLRVAYYENWEQTTYLLEGTWPGDPTDPEINLEAAIGQEAADQLALRPGDELVLDQRGWASSIPLRVRITAIIDQPVNTVTEAQNMLRISESRTGGIETNLLTTRQGVLRVATDYVPDTGTTFGWWVFFEHGALSYARRAEAIRGVDEFHQRLLAQFSGMNPIFESHLASVLDQYESEVALLNVPFGLLLLQIGALALFFLIVTAALVRRSARGEIAMLRSRGAPRWWLFVLDGLEALIICAIATAAAPFLARSLLELIVPLLTWIKHLDLELDATTFIFAGAAGAVAWIALMATLTPLLHGPLLLAGGSMVRGERETWWQRYYLDVVLLVIGAAALWRLINTRSPFATGQTGAVEADPLLLLAPILMFIAVGSLLLRLFPSITILLAKFTSRGRQLISALATWHISREPAHYGKITLLITLAIGIGWLATSFQATLRRSQYDQAAYATGADVRFEETDAMTKTHRVRTPDTYLQIPDVMAVSQATRYFVPNAAQENRQSLSGEVLAVDSASFQAVSYWRDDLGPLVMPPTSPTYVPGRALPFTPQRIGLWARLDQPVRDAQYQPVLDESGAMLFEPNVDHMRVLVQITLRLRDTTGNAIHVDLKPSQTTNENDGWFFLEGTLPVTAPGELRLESVYWANGWDWEKTRGFTFRLYLSELTLFDDKDARVSLDWLENDERWDFLHDSGADVHATTSLVPAPDRPNVISRCVTWDQDDTHSVNGFVLNYPEAGPIPAIASERLALLAGLLPGTSFQVGAIEGVRPQFELARTTVYFPTLYGDRRLFMVVDLDTLLYTLNRRPSSNVHPTEVWLRLNQDASPAAVVKALSQQSDQINITRIQTIDQAYADRGTNILLAGLSGLLYLAFCISLTLTVISLLTYTALTALQRRVQYGVLRALGLSKERLVVSIALEQVILLVTGTLLGAILGAAMSAYVLPTLAFGATGDEITPPFMIQMETSALAQYGVLILTVLGVTFGVSLALIRRLSLIDLLRFGEE